MKKLVGLTVAVALMSGGTLFALDELPYVKKATWQETLRICREQLAQTKEKKAEHLRNLGVEPGPWYAVGPFEDIDKSGYEDVFGPEKDANLDKSYNAGKLKWTPKPQWKDGVIHNLPGKDRVVANFLQRTIKIDRATTLSVYLGSNDGIQLWFNGEKVFGDNVGHKAEADQYIIELDFKKGDNQLMLKIDNLAAAHDFYFSMIPGGGVMAKQIEELWQTVENDFPDKQSRRRIHWDRNDRIWSDQWRAGDFGQLAARYAEACPKIESLADEAAGLAAGAATLDDLEKVREVYYRAKHYGEVLDSVTEKIDLMAEEVDYLDENYGEDDTKWQKYKSNMILLEKITRVILDQAKTGDIETLEELTKVEAGLEKVHRKMPLKYPSSPSGPRRFGAYYTRLKYSLEWDKPWRVGLLTDIIVRFDESYSRLVFWRGTNYMPCWAIADKWYTDGAVRRRGGRGLTRGALQPKSDKQNRYSHVRIIENHDARVVVHWRYSLVDVNYKLANIDPETNRGDWVDEVYTIYPDRIAIRKATLHTSAPEAWTQWQESTVLNQPRTKPDDNIAIDAVVVANLQGQVARYRWTGYGAPEFTNLPDGVCIQTVNIRAGNKPFSVFDPDGAAIEPYRGHTGGSKFTAWDHWPISQDSTWIRTVSDFNSPSSTSLSHIEWKDHARDETSVTRVIMEGITDGPIAQLVPLAKSWLNPPDLTTKARLWASACTYHGYDRTQRAYVLSCPEPGKPSEARLNLAANDTSPVVNPVFIIKGWGEAGAALEINGKEQKRGKNFRLGHRRTLDGSDLVVWVRIESVKPVRISLSPTE